MINLIKNVLFIIVLCGCNSPSNTQTVKVTCDQLGLYFMLPADFTPLDSDKIESVEKEGIKAIKEAFNKKALKGWQPSCLNLQDSYKSTILVSSISTEEAVELNGSIDEFIEKTFKDSNDFIARRFKQKANIDIDLNESVVQTRMTIAGYKVKKNAFTFKYGGMLMYFSRYYFFLRDDKLYLLGYTGSPKADNNDEIVNAIENAKLL